MREKMDQEREKIEEKYKNENEERESENLEKLTRIAGKYRKDAHFSKFKSKLLDQGVNSDGFAGSSNITEEEDEVDIDQRLDFGFGMRSDNQDSGSEKPKK